MIKNLAASIMLVSVFAIPFFTPQISVEAKSIKCLKGEVFVKATKKIKAHCKPTKTVTQQKTVKSNNSGGFVAGSCASLKKMGLSRFSLGNPNYTAARDRDGDGIACE